MIQYCINKTSCRRLQIGKYFSEEWKSKDCQQMCDICKCNIGNYDSPLLAILYTDCINRRYRYQISAMDYGSILGMLRNDISLRDSILLHMKDVSFERYQKMT